MTTIKRDRLPPCKKDGVDCPRRVIGCRSTCEEWLKWEAEHNANREAIRVKRLREHIVNSYFVDTSIDRELRWQLYMRRL